jgi:hypothetical protein
MNEDKLKVRIGSTKNEFKRHETYQSYFVKPVGKFWKRFFNKKVRKGENYKQSNWWHWS